MKILYLGVYRDGTGWAEAANRYILALDAAGAEVIPRPVRLSQESHAPPERVLELEARSARGCDAVIQHVLPHMMEPHGRLGLNTGLYFSETDCLKHTGWADRLSRMDLAVGCNAEMRDHALAAGVASPYAVVPVPCDPSAYAAPREPLPAVARLKEQGLFVFYTLGEMVRRKNLQGLLRAFHSEFDPEEPVALVVKAGRPGLPPHETLRHLEAFCEEIKRGMRLHGGDTRRYRREVLLTERLSAEDVFRLHAGCDCFVQPSYGEAWSIPAFDAMAMGKTPVVTDCGGYADYLRWESGEAGWLVPARRGPVFGVDDGVPGLFTGRESWHEADHFALCRAMREAYEDQGLRRRKAAAGVGRASDFSPAKVGGALLEVLRSHERAKRGGGA